MTGKMLIAGSLVLMSTAANAGVVLIGQSPIYHNEKVYETVEVCTQGTDPSERDILSGAFWGGVIGNNTGDGDAAAGAAIGALLGALSGEEAKCHTERRVVGSRQVLTGYSITLDVDGTVRTLTVNK